ncbi:sugar ABC transporter permease [Achromobacter sp. HZ01]|uniref:ABC transporter permease n=1 Tax=Achromobacter sp. HZ01 TaxID=1416886 RepID=UPI000DC52EC3|nr:ABC transporter permease [Achromobacter sp. HZ01]RAP65283.1 sugar ABC transporter permease [Achromobacter sp. HZ01]
MLRRSPWKISRTVIFALILREMRGRFGVNRLGAFWFVFEPIAHVLVLMTVFIVIRGKTLPGFDYAVFLVTGIVPYILFKNIALKGMEAVNANRALFSYRQIKPFDAIIARAIVEFSLMACVYLALNFGLGFWGGFDVAIHSPLHWILALGIGCVLSFGLALVLCVIADAFPELKTFLRIMFLPLYFLSGVIIPLWLLPRQILEWMMWNPFLHIIDELRVGTFLHYPNVVGIDLIYAAKISLTMLFVGMVLYRTRRLQLVAI